MDIQTDPNGHESSTSLQAAVGHGSVPHDMQLGQFEQGCFGTTPLKCYGDAVPASVAQRGLPCHTHPAYYQPVEASSAAHSCHDIRAALQQVPCSSIAVQQAGASRVSSNRTYQRAPFGSQQTLQDQPIFPPIARIGQQEQQQHNNASSSMTMHHSCRPICQPPAELSPMAGTISALLRFAVEYASPAAAIRVKEQLKQQVRLAAAAAREAGQHFDIAAVIKQLLPNLQEIVLRECRQAQQQRQAAAAASATIAATAAAAGNGSISQSAAISVSELAELHQAMAADVPGASPVGHGGSLQSLPSSGMPSAAAAAGAAAAAAAATAAGVYQTPDVSQQLQVILRAIQLLQQSEGASQRQ